MFEQLNDKFSRIVKDIRGYGKINDDNIANSLRNVRRALLEADVNFQAAKSFISRVKKVAIGEDVFTSVTPGQQFVNIILRELISFLGDKSDGIKFNSSGKTVIVLAGLQGAGKTTACVKLACFLKNNWDKSPYLIAADMQRPGAIDQLKTLCANNDLPVFSSLQGSVAEIVSAGIKESKSSDVVVIDTAGRLHIDDELMSELDSIVKVSNPDEILFVADGMLGQDAVNSVVQFDDRLDLTGVIMTKMDGDSRGGAALSIREVSGKSIKFISSSEDMAGFDVFHPERLAKRILGMGDVISLVEKAQRSFDGKSAKELSEKIIQNSFTLVDFQKQISQLQNMGSMSDLISMLPGASKISKASIHENKMTWIDAIIKSMTPYERLNPQIIDGSRRKRIANGSGRSVQEVNQLLKQFNDMKLMMKKIGKNKGKFNLPFNFK